jgi:hypothetical protein
LPEGRGDRLISRRVFVHSLLHCQLCGISLAEREIAPIEKGGGGSLKGIGSVKRYGVGGASDKGVSLSINLLPRPPDFGKV